MISAGNFCRVFIVVLAVGAYLALFYEPDTSHLDAFTVAQRVQLPNERVLTIELIGNPNVTAPVAAAALFGAYFKLQSNDRMQYFPLPHIRGRWPLPLTTPRDQWIGRYALVVGPDTVMPPQSKADDSTPQPVLATWSYGDYVQILHTGPYSAEEPTVARLYDRVRDNKWGTVLPGTHEEEYVLTSGKFVSVDPNRWRTLIRYQLSQSSK